MAEDPTAVIRRLIDEVVNDGAIAVADDLFSPDLIDYSLAPGSGVEGWKQAYANRREMWGRIQVQCEDFLVDGDRVAVRTRNRGTHETPIFGVEPTHKPFEIEEIHIFEVREGRITKHWGNVNLLGLFQQLGVRPMGPPA